MSIVAFIMGLSNLRSLLQAVSPVSPAKSFAAMPHAAVFSWVAVMLLLIFVILAGFLAVTPILIHMRRDRHPESSE